MAPAPDPDVPIYMGGDSAPALRRAAQLADGMLPPLNSQQRTPANLATIMRIREQCGRRADFDYVASAVKSRAPDELVQLAEHGIRSVHVDPFQLYVRRYGGLSMQERREALHRYADEVIRPHLDACAAAS